MEEVAYYLGMSLVPRIGPVAFCRLVDHFGHVSAAWSAAEEEVAAVPGLGPATARSLAETRSRLDLAAELDRIKGWGISLITFADPRYPRLLREIPDPPFLLYGLGELRPEDGLAVSVVGTRRPDDYGRRMARALARGIASAGVTVVSGLAYGIDRESHLGALEEGGRTIAVLGGGLRRIYPAGHGGLARRISRQGVILSEYPPLAEAVAGQFPARNRIIAGLTLGTVVVQAGRRSGALITASLALEQNREVFAVPGPVDNPRCEGTLALLREGAGLVRNAEDVLCDLGIDRKIEPASGAPSETEKGPSNRVDHRLEPEERLILSSFGSGPTAFEELLGMTGLAPGILTTRLTFLEIKGLVQQLPGRFFIRKRL